VKGFATPHRHGGRVLAVALLAFFGAGPGGADPPPVLPPPTPVDDPTLPPLPTQSPRNANYTIEAQLDPVQHLLTGSLVLEWRNLRHVPVSSFPFHLYWNAFENNLSTLSREEGRRTPPKAEGAEQERRYGFTHVRSIRLMDAPEVDLAPSFHYVHPDDNNADDHTVAEVSTPRPIGPQETARFKIEWTSRIPYGDSGRAGWVNDYYFISQWFPKIGVLQENGWNCHQFHATTEFFSDYGAYDVRLTVPGDYRVGATGILEDTHFGPDGSKILHFRENDVHDFAWTGSRRFLERTGRFQEQGYPPVEIRLLLQPEHESLAERYIEATRIALRSYGTWAAPYPYGHVTVVDPAWNSGSGGMEYPTLFTGGARVWAPRALQSPEGVTIHECGHQFWYGLVGNNEFEEAWLDEGFNTYHEWKASGLFLGPRLWGRRYFGPSPRTGWPFVAPGVWIGRGEEGLDSLRSTGTTDTMVREGWKYRTGASYGLNSYDKPALTLETLEKLVGDEVMTRIMRTYARRYRFAHPTTQDFMATVKDVTGQDYAPFFEQTWFSSELCDYAVTAKNTQARRTEGFLDTPGSRPRLAPKHQPVADHQGPYDSEVTVLRLGGVRLPVEVQVEFEDGQLVRETWDGQYRWTRFVYHRPVKIRRATVDPDGKLVIDVDPSNNAWVDETEPQASRAALKWSTRFMFWLQNLFELETIFG
jgi:hypothetical protein